MRFTDRLPLLILFIACSNVEAACVLESVRRLVKADKESAVELEMPISAKVIKLLTSRDGTIAALFQRGELDSADARRLVSKYRNILRRGKWDDLSPEKQIELIADITKMRDQRYEKNRTIFGLVPRKTVELTFAKPTTFMGVKYGKGTHTISIEGALKGPVEYRSPEDFIKFQGVELHFRRLGLPSEVSEDARTLQMGLDVPVTHQHVHALADLRVQQLKANPRLEVGLHGDHFRRANLAAELVYLIEREEVLFNHSVGRTKYFAALTKENLAGVTSYFQSVADGKPKRIGDQFKLGWIGFRGSDKYDAPGLFGYEFRAIQEGSTTKVEGALMDAVRDGMTTGETGLSKDVYQAWLKEQPKNAKIEDLVASNLYNRPWDKVHESASKQVAEIYSADDFKTLVQQVTPTGTEHLELKMLFHDWSKDPILYGQPKLSEKILNYQIRAVKELRRNSKRPVDEIVSDFAKYSGLYDEVLKSVGVRIKH